MKSLVPMNGASPGFLAGRRASGSLAAARRGIQASFAVIGIKGKNWWIKKAGDEEVIRDQTSNRPVQALDVVIVGVADNVTKTYYASGYVEGERNAPDCMSSDGITPDAGVPHKQNPVCSTCPQNRFGSRVTPAGKNAKACADQRKIALVPVGDILNEDAGGPMLLRLPAMSLINFRKYADELERKGASDIWWVGTRLEFDPESAFPRIMFSPIGWVTEEQDALIQELQETGQIEDVLRAAPIDSGPAVEVVDNAPLAGAPPARATMTLAPRQAQQAPPEQVPPPEEPEEDEPEPPAPTPPPPAPPPPPQAVVRRGTSRPSPFQSASTSRPAAGNTRGNSRVSAQGAPTAAPPELESVIDDLLDT